MANYVKNVCGLQQFFQKGFTNLEKKNWNFVISRCAESSAKRCNERGSKTL